MAKKLTNKEQRVRNLAKRIQRDGSSSTAQQQTLAHMRLHSVSLSTATRDWNTAMWRLLDNHFSPA